MLKWKRYYAWADYYGLSEKYKVFFALVKWNKMSLKQDQIALTSIVKKLKENYLKISKYIKLTPKKFKENVNKNNNKVNINR